LDAPLAKCYNAQQSPEQLAVVDAVEAVVQLVQVLLASSPMQLL